MIKMIVCNFNLNDVSPRTYLSERDTGNESLSQAPKLKFRAYPRT